MPCVASSYFLDFLNVETVNPSIRDTLLERDAGDGIICATKGLVSQWYPMMCEKLLNQMVVGSSQLKIAVKNLEHMRIPLEQIKLATNNFHDDFQIGRGGYGKVYKADLFHFDVQKYVKSNVFKDMSVTELLGFQRRKSTVALKRLDRRYGQGTAEFLQEISVLPYFRHQNLVTIVGYCDEDRERILVYEYASNGSLDEYISSTGSTNNHTWALRLQICLDAARGLEFLHNGVGEHHRIIHRDIKSSNILLGHNWVGKISDFGLSRIGPANLQATFVMTQVDTVGVNIFSSRSGLW
ncbi:phloem protein 2-like protein [Tanacetum coccineum]